jgi:hypothetical protein
VPVSRRARLALAGAALLAVACVREEPLELPPIAGYRAMIVIDDTDGATTARAVAIGEREVRFPLILDRSRENRFYLLLYDAAMSELGFDEGTLGIERGCGRTLPPAKKILEAKTTLGGVAPWVDEAKLPPALQALRLRPRSPSCSMLADPSRPPLIDVRCASAGSTPLVPPFACVPRATQNACTLAIDTGDCFLGRLEGSVYEQRDTCFPVSAAFGSCRVESEPSDAALSISCTKASGESCAFLLYDPPPARFEVAHARVVEISRPYTEIGFERPPRGYLSDLAVLDDRIAVATFDGEESRWSCFIDRPGKVFFLDPETMGVIETATTPPCLTQIVRDPAGDGFAGAYGGSTPKLGRFDRHGRLVASASFEVPAESRAEPYFATSIATGGATIRAIAVQSQRHHRRSEQMADLHEPELYSFL